MSMMERKFIIILEDCLSRLDQGETLPEVLEVYPHLIDKLRPILLVAMMSRTLPQPVPGHTALRNGKNLLLAEMDALRGKDPIPESGSTSTVNNRVTEWFDRVTQPIQTGIARLKPGYRLATLVLVMLFTGGYLTVSASGLGNRLFHELYSGFEQVGEILRFFNDDGLDTPDNYLGDFKPGIGFLLENKGDMLDGFKLIFDDDSSDGNVYDLDGLVDDEDVSQDPSTAGIPPDEEDLEEKVKDKDDKDKDKDKDKDDKDKDKDDKDDKDKDKDDKDKDKDDKDKDDDGDDDDD